MLTDWVYELAGQCDASRPLLQLLGGPSLTVRRRPVRIPGGDSRLLVFVALHRGRVNRANAAGTLWPVGEEARAAGNLRSSLWRLKRAGLALINADKYSLALNEDVLVDLHLIGDWASRLIDGTASPADLAVKPWGVDSLDLLPGWYDDWAVMERERFRQRLLHGLESLSCSLMRSGRHAEAVEAAMLAVTSEPLRESAQRVLLEAHVAEGNWVEGRRGLDAYRRLLQREMGAEPHPELADMLYRYATMRRAASYGAASSIAAR